MVNGNILVVGSLAYDHLMKYDGLFKEAAVPGNYSMSFTVASRSISFGGCAGNIAYTLRLFKEHPVIVTVAGRDFGEYKNLLECNGIDTSAVKISKAHLTASAFIATDKDQNQITVFDPGAMAAKVNLSLDGRSRAKKFSLAIIAPDTPSRMTSLALQCVRLGIPYIFDPGQQLGVYGKKDLLLSLKNADILIVNKYESFLLGKKLNLTQKDVSALTPVFIRTDGAKGSFIKINSGKSCTEFQIDAVKPKRAADPTGCGDAFRGGLLAGLNRGFDIEKAARTGTLAATYSIENRGTQSHSFSLKDFSSRFEKCFGVKF